MDAFKPGDVVQLKSGGDVMTVEAIGGGTRSDWVHCVWFAHNHELKRAGFPPHTLDRYEPKA